MNQLRASRMLCFTAVLALGALCPGQQIMVTTHNIQPAATAGAGPDRKVARPARVPDDVIAYRAQSRAQATSAAVAKIQTVFVIAMENHNFVQPTGLATSPEQLLGNPAAPYINSLITPGNPNAAHVSFA